MAQAAREYAKALYSSLKSSDEKDSARSFLKGLSSLLLDDPKFMDQIKSKAINAADTKKTMEALLSSLKLSETMKNFFNLLVDKGRMEIIHELAAEFELLSDVEKGIMRGLVKSALVISDDKKTELETKFSKRMDKKVILSYQQDAKVVAGVRVEIGAFTFDDTVETHIKKIKENLNRSWN